jgi:hypothetical protein
MDTNHTNGKHDVWTHRILVAGLASCSILDIALIGYLSSNGHEVPTALSALAFTTIGALAGMLTTIMRGGGS